MCRPPRVTLRLTKSTSRSPTPNRERFGRSAAAEQRADPGQHLGERKRLDEIVVGAAVEAGHAILQRVAGGQHEHRRFDTLASKRRQHLQAVAARQHHVEQDDVEPFRIETEEGALAGVFDDDVVAVAFEAFLEGACHLLLVFDNQYPRASRLAHSANEPRFSPHLNTS